MRYALYLLVLLAGCGGGDGRTPYGPADRVRAYRQAIDPLIDQINAVDGEMRALAVGSTGRATGQNLAAACALVEERLAAVLASLEGIAPPSRLEDLHANMGLLVELRLQACARVRQGWQVEQEESFAAAAPLYEQAEAQFSRAGGLSLVINAELEKVDGALAGTGERRLLS